MVAVWILFAVGLIAIIVGIIPTILEVYAYIYAYIITFKDLLNKKAELRKERINALKNKEEITEEEVELDVAQDTIGSNVTVSNISNETVNGLANDAVNETIEVE